MLNKKGAFVGKIILTVHQFYSSIENVGVNSGILSMTTLRHFVI